MKTAGASLLYLVLALIMFRSLPALGRTVALDPGDPILNAAILG